MISDYYDQVWSRKLSLPKYATIEARWRTRWDFALKQIEDGSRVLDIACGDGVLGEMLIRQKRCEVLGLDISSFAREMAGRRGVKTLSCDISNDRFPVEDASFDAATLLCCLEHIFDPAHALRESARVVRPGGKILVTVPNALNIRFRLDFLGGRLNKDLIHTNDGEGLHIRFFNYKEDFDRLVREDAPLLRLVSKQAELKNPNAYGAVARGMLHAGMFVWPNLFAEYVHCVLLHKE